jgi:hypothetical protein
LSRLFDGITGVIPTDKQVEEMTKWKQQHLQLYCLYLILYI